MSAKRHSHFNRLSCFLLFLCAPPLFAQGMLVALEEEIGALVQAAKPSVVTVLATKTNTESTSLFRLFGQRKTAENEFTVGTGLIISSEGFLLTKDSILRNAGTIEVALDNNTSHRVEWVARDSSRGIALLKISAPNLQPVRFSMTDALHAGSWVTVIGNALGVPHAVSIGVVSAIQPDGLLQISANVDPGSNGSPVFDAHAHAIGMVMGRVGLEAMESSASPYFSNTALVHPFADLLPFVRDSFERYYAQHGWIGVTVVSDATSPGRPRILKLSANGPGQESGLQVGDTITHFDGEEVDSPSTLGLYVNKAKPGDVVLVKVLRLAQALTFEVRVTGKTPVALHELNFTANAEPTTTPDPPPAWKPSMPHSERQLQLQLRIDELEKKVRALQNSYKRN